MQNPINLCNVNEALALGVTSTQDLGSELGQLQVARNLEENNQAPSLWSAFNTCQEIGQNNADLFW